ncbi:MAG: DUF3866 family protein [Actinomycetota bacterium]
MPVMVNPGVRLRRGVVLDVLEVRPGAVELLVEVEDGPARAVAYPVLVGPVRPGDAVLLNTTAVWLGLGTGGVHFVVAVEGGEEVEPPERGRTMKLRYTPHQVSVVAAEEHDSPDRAAMEGATGLDGLPVVWVPLHSMVGPAAAGARAAGATRVAYVMTDGAALPAGLSRLAAALRESGLIESVITTGQAFGGDLETVSVFSGLLAGRHVVGADVLVVGDGPGNAGTGTTWGASDVESAMALNAVAILGGRPVAALRVSFADPRDRHRGLSHHSITALSRVALVPVHVAVPALDDERRRTKIWDSLREAGLEGRHQLVEVTGQPALDLLGEHGIEPDSMGRKPSEDPEFFLAAGAAGVLAGRMAAGDHAWRTGRS